MKKRHWNLPNWKIFRCTQCDKKPGFIYKASKYKKSKKCIRCVLGIFEKLFAEIDEAK